MPEPESTETTPSNAEDSTDTSESNPCIDASDLDLLSDEQLFVELRSLEDPERSKALTDIQDRYVEKISEYRGLANASIQEFHKHRASHVRWRRRLVVLTGILAILNLVIAYTSGLGSDEFTWSVKTLLTQILPLGAAVFAATIAILSNLENLYRFSDRAQGFREAREVLLDASVDFEMQWFTKVKPFGNRPEAVHRAALLYRQLCEQDHELRVQVKELTQPPNAEGRPQ